MWFYTHFPLFSDLHITHKTVICLNSHNSSNWDSHITRQLGHKHTFYQNIVPTKNFLSSYIRINLSYLSVCLLRKGQFLSISCIHVFLYRCVTKNCCFIKDLSWKYDKMEAQNKITLRSRTPLIDWQSSIIFISRRLSSHDVYISLKRTLCVKARNVLF